MSALNWLDLSIIGIVAISVLIGVVRGFVRESLSFIAWIAAAWAALAFYKDVANLFTDQIQMEALRLLLSAGLIFIVTLVLMAIVNYVIAVLVEKTGFTGTDKLLGLVFGFARGVLLVVVIVLLAEYSPLTEEPWWRESRLIPAVHPLQNWMKEKLEQHVPDDVFSNKGTSGPDALVQG